MHLWNSSLSKIIKKTIIFCALSTAKGMILKMNKLFSFKRLLLLVMVSVMLLGVSTIIITETVQATPNLPTIGGGDSGGGFDDIGALVEDAIWKVRAIGALLIVLALIIGLIILDMSLGNSQKRALGLSAIICAAIGIYGVGKAPSIANWIIKDAEKTQASSSINIEDTIFYIFNSASSLL